MYTYKYPRPALTTDAIIFAFDNNDRKLKVLLIERKNPPFKGMYALPGGFVDMDETVEQTAARELKEETGLDNIPLVQMHTFSEPNRDPRGRTVSVAFFALCNKARLNPFAGDDAKTLAWFDILDLPDLAFDHKEIIDFSVKFALENFRCQNTKDEFTVYIDSLTTEQIVEIINILQKYEQH